MYISQFVDGDSRSGNLDVLSRDSLSVSTNNIDRVGWKNDTNSNLTDRAKSSVL